jgi:hypothetical protein
MVELSGRQTVYPTPYDEAAAFKIITIAPTGTQATRYKLELTTCFDQHGELRETFPSQKHNQVSAALLLQYGNARAVLGGDVEGAGWQETLTLVHPNELQANLVKVSHHGSTNGYTDDLWGHFAHGARPYAVVTPARRFRLPRKEALDHIKTHAGVVLATCQAAVPGEYQFSEEMQSESRILLQTKFKSWTTPTKKTLARDTGICSVYLEPNGDCTYSCEGAAGQI